MIELILPIFALLYIVLPSYFAYEINTSFPLLTASRVLLILLFIAFLIQQKGKLKLGISNNKKVNKGLLTYFVLTLIPNICFLTETTEAVKRIFVLCVEEMFLVWLLCQILKSRKIIEYFIELMIWGSFGIAIVSIIGSLQGVNYFSYLNTVTRKVAIANFSRLGFLRAEAGFGHAVHYGLYSTVIIVMVYYLYETKNKKRFLYLLILIVDLLAFVFANSRGSMLALGVVIIIRIFNERHRLIQFLRTNVMFITVVLIGLTSLLLIVPSFGAFFGDIFISLLNSIFGDVQVLENYGTNENGFHSRLFQISGVYWVITRSPIVGMGPMADGRGKIQYLSDFGNWYVTNSYDVGYFAILCDYGIIGFIGYLALMLCIIKTVKRVNISKEPISKMFGYAFIAYFLCYLSSVGVDKLFWVLVALLISLDNILNQERSQVLKNND